MAKNDKILIDGIIDERCENQHLLENRSEVFEYFVFEQILKEYDLSYEEICSGWVDGKDDGGIDGFYIFINGHLLTETEKFTWPKTGCVIEVHIITCKHHDTFKQAPLDSMVATLKELLDFSTANSGLSGNYSEQILSQRNNLTYAYRKVSAKLSQFNMNFYYASRGTVNELGDSVKARGNHLKQIAIQCFDNCISNFYFYGSTELIKLYRKLPDFNLDLPFTDSLSHGKSYIILAKLKDYYNFITDNHKLRRYLFDSNVRDYMGLNPVNEDIMKTLQNPDSSEFWWLNNGVTILASNAISIGKTITIENIQIVNGLQTSETISRYYKNGGKDLENRHILIKIIVSNENENQDEIIKATNNQTIVELTALHATDKIQRDIEDILKTKDLFYERRTNYYKNQGVDHYKIITLLYLASGYLNLILKLPESASFLKSCKLRKATLYSKIFSEETNLEVWPQIANILKKTDKFLETKRQSKNTKIEKFLKSRRQSLSFITLARYFKNFFFTENDLIHFNLSDYTTGILEESWEIIAPLYAPNDIRRTFLSLCKEISLNEDISGYERLIKMKKHTCFNNITVDESFLEKVETLLNKQEKTDSVIRKIARKLNCKQKKIEHAVWSLDLKNYAREKNNKSVDL